MIVVFGAKRCKHCKSQKEALQNTYGNEGWMYADVVENLENYKVASEINVENIPAIIIFNSKDVEIFRKEGTMSPDQSFNIENKSAIPFTDRIAADVNNGKCKKAILAHDYGLKNGSVVKAKTYNGKNICDVKIVSSNKCDVDSLPFADRLLYLKRGGRKDLAWVVSFEKVS